MMRQYLLYSSTVHTFGIAILFLAARPGKTVPHPVTYSIDFIGSSGIATSAMPTGPEGGVSGKAISSELVVPSKKTKTAPAALLRPSVLKNARKTGDASKAEPAGAGDAGGAASGVRTDFPNFPYPWYVSQVRLSLWESWSARMPRKGLLSCVLMFRIQRDGSTRKLSVEKSSGNKLFDFSAMSAAERAGPFPPLPSDFPDPELVVHVEFRITE